MNKVRWQKFSRSFILFVAAIVLTLAPSATFALDDALLRLFAENNIIFYNPENSSDYDPCSNSDNGNRFHGDGEHWDGSCNSITGANAAWIKSQISYIQNISSRYGLPWEVIIAQSFAESGGAKNEVCPYNPIGIKGSPNCDGAHRTFSSYNEAWDYYAEHAVSVGLAKNLFPSDPYSFIEYIQYGVPHGSSYAQCSKQSYIDSNEYGCGGHQIGDPTPIYVNSVSKWICGIQKWAEENGVTTSAVTYATYNPDTGATTTATNSNPANVSTSGYTWSNGWITGLNIIKEDANGLALSETANKIDSYTTSDHKPNKILLHSTEGTSGGIGAYPASNMFPAHFTIDLKKKSGSQHFPLNQPALAIKSYDKAGPIQIEIVGFSSGHKDSEYNLSNFTDEDWDYLASILIAISQETGIPLTSSVDWANPSRIPTANEFTNYQGILGHMHATGNDHSDPGNIWDQVSAAIARNPDGNKYGGNICSSTLSDNENSLADLVKAWAWPDYTRGKTEQMPAYKEYMKTAPYRGACNGNDCGAFVSNIMRASGWDSNYELGSTSLQKQYLSKNWEEITDISSLRLGDVGVVVDGGNHHVILYVGDIPGFNSKTASASQCDRAPMAGRSDENLNKYTWYRKK